MDVAVSKFRAVCKLRWIPKVDTDNMVISNTEALKMATMGVMEESNGDYQAGAVAMATAEGILQAELKQYLAGQQILIPTPGDPVMGMGGLGGVM